MSASISVRVAFVSAVVAGMAWAEAAIAAPPQLPPNLKFKAWKLGEQPPQSPPNLKFKAWKLGEQPPQLPPNLKFKAWKLGDQPPQLPPNLKFKAWKLGDMPPKGPAPPPPHPPHHPPKGFGHPGWWHGPVHPPYVARWQPPYEPAPYQQTHFPPLELLNENPVHVVCWIQGERVVIPPGENVALPSDRENRVVFHNGEQWEEHTLITGVYKFLHPGPVWELVRVP